MIDVVRLAQAADEPELMDMCRALHRENGLFPINEERVHGALHSAFDRKGALLGVIGEPGRIEASIYLMLAQFWYSDAWHLAELWNYVRPEHRKSNNAKNLITFAKSCAEQLALPLVIGVISNDRTAAKIKLYERQLMKPSGAWWIYGADTSVGAQH